MGQLCEREGLPVPSEMGAVYAFSGNTSCTPGLVAHTRGNEIEVPLELLLGEQDSLDNALPFENPRARTTSSSPEGILLGIAPSIRREDASAKGSAQSMGNSTGGRLPRLYSS